MFERMILYKVTMVIQLTLLSSILFVKARFTVGLTWNTERLSNNCCQNKNQLLMWNFTKGENERIMELQWFFNETTLICLDSESIGFQVETLYDSRVERIGTAGILLKNVSLSDAGKYTLYVKLAEETIRNIQNIFLFVYEPVPDQCKSIIQFHSQDVLRCSTTCVESSQLSSGWTINSTRDPLVIGPFLRINAGIYEEARCCLHNLKCHDDDQFKFCIPKPFSSRVVTEDYHTKRPNEPENINATNRENSNTYIVMIILNGMLAAFVIVVTTFICLWRRGRNSLDIKPQNSKTTRECTGDIKQVDTVAGTTDPLLHHSNSNQNIQIVNNVCIDGDFLMHMVESQRKSMIDLEALRDETRKFKLQLSSNKQSKQLYPKLIDKSIEMTEAKCEQQHDSDTDSSETSNDFQDAVSVLS